MARPIRTRTERSAARLARMAARWARDQYQALAHAEPDMGPLYNRLADNWRPLYAIADLAGDNWPELTRQAMIALTPSEDENASRGEQLLADIRIVFDQEELTSNELVERLIGLEGRPWAEFGRSGRHLTMNALARLLKPFGIRPSFIGPEAARSRGYRRAAFTDPFERHLPPLAAHDTRSTVHPCRTTASA